MTTGPHQGTDISAELEILLGGMGLPIVGTTDRAQAVGLLVNPAGNRAATVEWLASTAVRNAAACEHLEGRAEGRAALFHSTTRAYVHRAISGVLEELGYSVSHTPAGLRVEGSPDVSGRETAASIVAASPVAPYTTPGRAPGLGSCTP
ncbi:hypothetical protein [Streptomyces wuyuanensis]|uniref:Uncharacterized protein n=1 Tax=Streptomyces wuyuanensis TaxID=1196353 RepID=A0A1G9ZXX0_9ACTN|nr:hypothetical protein [Streptomyces wuyuanensis]SDN26432.1 hypothetical protein SAMN05444921_1235 [Streptomyces wuyuanensis]